MEHELAEHVRAAAKRTEVCSAVTDLYARLQGQVEQRKPICVQSGKCCRFEEYGHRLYVTTMELAAFVEQMPLLSVESEHQGLLPIASEGTFGGCPFQAGKMCGVHAIRPFGCRVFYCDPSATVWQQEQYERFHAELKQLHDKLSVQYFYVEWRQALIALDLAEQKMPCHGPSGGFDNSSGIKLL